ncbi:MULTISPECIES: hypothetical protein [Actinosynnema]|uniref:hypothetical protein n=1 Tax=Actinosynnema TaxID=40566 RepID=UPI0020A2D0A3|nr:hypothetical protein [Actinosynnema pretiosum]
MAGVEVLVEGERGQDLARRVVMLAAGPEQLAAAQARVGIAEPVAAGNVEDLAAVQRTPRLLVLAYRGQDGPGL